MALMIFSKMRLVPFAIGMGIVAYSAAVAFYTLLAIWRLHRAVKREARRQAIQNQSANGRVLVVETCSRPPAQIV
jgi:membrane protein implicated in regulation of membrane protease activity